MAEMAGSKESAVWYSIDTRIKIADAECMYGIGTSFILSLWVVYVCVTAASSPTQQKPEFSSPSHIRREAKIATFNWGWGCFPQLRKLGVEAKENKPA